MTETLNIILVISIELICCIRLRHFKLDMIRYKGLITQTRNIRSTAGYAPS